jgi:hypothetical protein
MKSIAPRLPLVKGGKGPAVEGKLRPVLAAWVTADDNPYFARNAVNQVWGQVFGAPLLGALDRPVPEGRQMHQEVLRLLAEDFTAAGHDVKRLVRILVLSRAYQLQAGAGASGEADPKEDEERHRRRHALARFRVRPLSVDQLYQSIVQATGYRGVEPPADPAAEEMANNTDVAVNLLAERPLTVQRSLALLNGDFVQKAAQAGASAALTVNGQRPGKGHVEWLFWTTLSRRPTADEMTAMLGLLQENKGARGLEDVLWVLLNSTEFNTNH